MAGACRTQASVFWGFCRVLRASQRGQGFFGVCCLLRVLGVFKVVGFFGVKFLWRLQAILGGVCGFVVAAELWTGREASAMGPCPASTVEAGHG